MSKFSKIVYPFFGRAKPPHKFAYDNSKIYVYLFSHRKKVIIDDYEIDGGNYLARYAKRFADPKKQETLCTFESTSTSLAELLINRPSWGVDATGRVYTFYRNPNSFKVKLAKLKTIQSDYIIVEGISYPIIVPHQLPVLDFDPKVLRAKLVYIDYKWYLLEFTYERVLKETSINL